MQNEIDIMVEKARSSASVASEQLTTAYNAALRRNVMFIGVCVLAILMTFYSVFILVIRKLTITNHQIHDIIEGIDKKRAI